jgi:hypothetical protein
MAPLAVFEEHRREIDYSCTVQQTWIQGFYLVIMLQRPCYPAPRRTTAWDHEVHFEYYLRIFLCIRLTTCWCEKRRFYLYFLRCCSRRWRYAHQRTVQFKSCSSFSQLGFTSRSLSKISTSADIIVCSSFKNSGQRTPVSTGVNLFASLCSPRKRFSV